MSFRRYPGGAEWTWQQIWTCPRCDASNVTELLITHEPRTQHYPGFDAIDITGSVECQTCHYELSDAEQQRVKDDAQHEQEEIGKEYRR